MSVFFNHKPDIQAFDTETYKGNLLIICNAYDCFEYNPDKPIKLIDWLYTHASADLNFLYNLKFDLGSILKPYITNANADNVRKFKELKVGKYLITFIHKRFFAIKNTRTHKNNSRKFFDIAQYYMDKEGKIMTLDNASKQELGIGKNNEELGIDRAKIGTEYGYYSKHKELIIKYCKKDAELTMNLAKKRVDVFAQLFNGKYPKSYISPASLSKAYLNLYHYNEKFAFAKLISQLPKNKQKTAFDYIVGTYHGGLFYDLIYGNIKNVSEIDINSAYPDKIRNLKSIINGRIFYVKKYTLADYGFYHVKMKYTNIPFPYRISTGMIIYPQSAIMVDNYITEPEYNYMIKHNIPVKIIDGYVIFCNTTENFKDYAIMYAKRQEYKKHGNTSLQEALKYVLNATYGSFAESKNGLKAFTNFVYASYITALTRLQILNACEKIGWQNVVSIRTDAIIYKGDYRENSKELGKFKQEFENCDMLNYSTGISIIEGDNYNNMSKRGFPSLTKNDLLNAHGHTLTITEKAKPLSMVQGMIEHRLIDINNFEEKRHTFDLYSHKDKQVFSDNVLNFECFNAQEIKPEQLNKNTTQKPYFIDIDKYNDWFIKSENMNNIKEPKTRIKKFKGIGKIKKYLNMCEPENHRQTEQLNRFLSSNTFDKYIEHLDYNVKIDTDANYHIALLTAIKDIHKFINAEIS